jgi:glycosyltransferase involved in cell wall biosynthesis
VCKVWPIVKTICEQKIDLVHVNDGLRLSKPGIIAAWLTGLPCVCHERMFHKLDGFDKIFSRFVDTFIYISRAINEDYTAQVISADKGTVIHNAVNLSDFSQGYDTTLVRSEFGWTAHDRLVGVIGRLDSWKGHEYFLDAVAEVSKKYPMCGV